VISEKLDSYIKLCMTENTSLKSENDFLVESLKIAESRIDEVMEELRVSNKKLDRFKIDLIKMKSNNASSGEKEIPSSSNVTVVSSSSPNENEVILVQGKQTELSLTFDRVPLSINLKLMI
jgi:hypothetical protein